jgi:hypothetical protein
VDLALYGRVLWRFRALFVVGAVLAVTLAFLSMVRVSSDGLEYREQELWQNQSTLFITQQGFPEGRALFPPAEEPAPGEKPDTYPYASIGRFTSLVDLYAQMANSDAVKRIMLRKGPLVGTVQASPIPPSTTSGASPLIAIIGKGPTPDAAATMVKRGTDGLIAYLSQQQDEAGIPVAERVDVRVLKQVDRPLLLEGRKKTLPVVVLLAVLCATVGLAFALENARPSTRPLQPVAEDSSRTETRRSA